MQSTSIMDAPGARAAGRQAGLATDAVEQAFRLLHIGFIVAPIVAGADKFFNLLVDWHQYVPNAVARIIDPGTLMPIVGVIEIAAGILVALKPRIGGMVVAAWLLLIIINLLMIPGYFDVALRDLGLALGALALSRLAAAREARTA